MFKTLWNVLFPKKCKLQHYKQAGYPMPKNMKETIIISLFNKDDCSVYECNACGVRAFLCSYSMMGSKHHEIIDRYINYHWTLDELVRYLTHNEIKFRLCDITV